MYIDNIYVYIYTHTHTYIYIYNIYVYIYTPIYASAARSTWIRPAASLKRCVMADYKNIHLHK